MSLESLTNREFSTSTLSSKAEDVESMLHSGSIDEAESSLREALSLSHEEARALLGRLEYQRGNLVAAIHVFEGIDISIITSKLKQAISEKEQNQKGRSCSDSGSGSGHAMSMHAVSLLLEAVFLKAKSLQGLGMANEAAQQCKLLLEAVDSALPYGIANAFGDEGKLHETVCDAFELLPELWKQAGFFQEAICSYRRALTSPWSMDTERISRIQKEFAILLLYGGVDAPPPSLGLQIEDAYIPRNNIEEAILLLMILLRKHELRRTEWDPSIMDHLTFALSISKNCVTLAKCMEEVLPGIYDRSERWYILALCYSAGGENEVALNLLRKILNSPEKADNILAGVLATKLCTENIEYSEECMYTASKTAQICFARCEHFIGVANHLLGVSLGKKARSSVSESERVKLQKDALDALMFASKSENKDPKLVYQIALENAEQRNLNVALDFANKYLEMTAGASLQGWKLLALILSAQQHFTHAETIIEAALDETGKWDQGDLLRLKAKVQLAQGNHSQAIETYKLLLALLQAQRKATRPAYSKSEGAEERGLEEEAWQDLSYLYLSLGKFHDGEVCLEKAQMNKHYSPVTWHTTGLSYESQKRDKEALFAFSNALAIDPTHVPSMIAIASVLQERGGGSLAVARCFLTEALRIEPTNHVAWFQLGIVHKREGFIQKAIDCFQAAIMLQESAPPDKFSSA